MKSINFKICLFYVAFLVFMLVRPAVAQSQRVVKIGEAEISIQSPISVKKADQSDNNEIKSKYPRRYSETYFGMGSVIPVERDSRIDMHYGRINSLELGTNYFYRPAAGYAIGALVQYTYYNYKLRDAAANDVIMEGVPGEVRKEYFRTDNIGTGLVNRFYFFPGKKTPFMLDIGGYVDFAFSKRYNVKTIENGDREKYKYRDGSMFNPIQAGIYGAVTVDEYSVFVRYRATNLFNPDKIAMELPEWTIGVRFILD